MVRMDDLNTRMIFLGVAFLSVMLGFVAIRFWLRSEVPESETLPASIRTKVDSPWLFSMEILPLGVLVYTVFRDDGALPSWWWNALVVLCWVLASIQLVRGFCLIGCGRKLPHSGSSSCRNRIRWEVTGCFFKAAVFCVMGAILL